MNNIKTTDDLIQALLKDFGTIYDYMKNLAPENSSYIGLYNFKKVDFIFVNNKRVYTNTGTLKNSVMQSVKDNGGSIVYDIYVPDSLVPYYDRAVLSKTLTRARHYGRIDYGTVRYTNVDRWKESFEEEVDNRNYLYYMKAEGYVNSIISKYANQKFYVEDDITRWKNGTEW